MYGNNLTVNGSGIQIDWKRAFLNGSPIQLDFDKTKPVYIPSGIIISTYMEKKAKFKCLSGFFFTCI